MRSCLKPNDRRRLAWKQIRIPQDKRQPRQDAHVYRWLDRLSASADSDRGPVVDQIGRGPNRGSDRTPWLRLR